MMKEMGSFLTKYPQLLHPYLETVLKSNQFVLLDQQYQTQKQQNGSDPLWDQFSAQMASFESLYTQAAMEICNHCALSFTEKEFNLLKTHIQGNYQTMS